MSHKQAELNDVDAKALDKLIAGEIFTSTEVQTNLEILCDDLAADLQVPRRRRKPHNFWEQRCNDTNSRMSTVNRLSTTVGRVERLN